MKAHLTTAVLSSAILALAAACGDVVVDPTEGAEVPAATAVVDAGGVFPADTPTSCPSFRPIENSPCQVIGSSCEYGSSADMQCNETLVCLGQTFDGYWFRRSTSLCSPSLCPAGDVASLDGKPCDVAPEDGGVTTDADEIVCNMTDGVCACTTGPDAKRAHARKWICQKPIGTCPARRPLAGTPCTGSLWCDYGSCKYKRGLLMQCQSGVWVTGGAPCE